MRGKLSSMGISILGTTYPIVFIGTLVDGTFFILLYDCLGVEIERVWTTTGYGFLFSVSKVTVGGRILKISLFDS